MYPEHRATPVSLPSAPTSQPKRRDVQVSSPGDLPGLPGCAEGQECASGGPSSSSLEDGSMERPVVLLPLTLVPPSSSSELEGNTPGLSIRGRRKRSSRYALFGLASALQPRSCGSACFICSLEPSPREFRQTG